MVQQTQEHGVLDRLQGRLMEACVEDLLGWAEAVVVAQKPSSALLAKIQASGLPVIDLVGYRAAFATA